MFKVKTSDSEFRLPKNANLLEALEKTGHAVEYQCKSGYCGSCRLKLRSGSVDYAEMPMAFIQNGEILPCCCRVLTDIELDCKLRNQ